MRPSATTRWATAPPTPNIRSGTTTPPTSSRLRRRPPRPRRPNPADGSRIHVCLRRQRVHRLQNRSRRRYGRPVRLQLRQPDERGLEERGANRPILLRPSCATRENGQLYGRCFHGFDLVLILSRGSSGRVRSIWNTNQKNILGNLINLGAPTHYSKSILLASVYITSTIIFHRNEN